MRSRPHKQITPLDVGSLLSSATRQRIAGMWSPFKSAKMTRLLSPHQHHANIITRMAGFDALPRSIRLIVHDIGMAKAGAYRHASFIRAAAAAERSKRVKDLRTAAADCE